MSARPILPPQENPKHLSGILINQNAQSNGIYTLTDWVYQTFTMPSDLARGTTVDELQIPTLTGMQVMVTVTTGYADKASLKYTLQYLTTGWNTLVSGTVTGTHTDGQHWFSIHFPQQIPVTSDQIIASSPLFRLGIYNEADVENVAFVSPNPLTQKTDIQGQAYESDGITPISPESASINFRILGFIADSGPDFLGNETRAVVEQNSATNVLSNDDTYWQSPPFPSPFAVSSLYFDLRQNAVAPTLTQANQIPDPSFEYDALGQPPSSSSWTAQFVNATAGMNTIDNIWASNGLYSWRISTSPATANNGYVYVFPPSIGVLANQQWAMAATANFSTDHTGTRWYLSVNWYDVNGLLIRTDYPAGTTTPAVPGQTSTISGVVTAPANAINAVPGIVIALDTIDQVADFALDAVMFIPTSNNIVPSYNDGDTPGYQWAGQFGQSSTLEIVEPTQASTAVVVDGVEIDPITPNMAMNVYYSQDDAYNNDPMTESDWEQKLWTRVPKVFLVNNNQEYVFPSPITAKYIKLEFTNLQARVYDPGPFAQPIRYKKFPTWVLQYFVNMLSTPSFLGASIDVQFDALDLAYNYYLGDVQQPTQPSAPDQSASTQLTNFFSPSALSNIDATTLAKINLIFATFTQTQTGMADTSSIVGQFVTQMATNSNLPQTYEQSVVPIPDYSTVSSLNRSDVVFEQSLPVMYFFLTCRHAYLEAYGEYQYNKAYVCAIKSVSFVRHDYTTPIDHTLYIESGADTFNMAFSDFFVGDLGIWFTSEAESESSSLLAAVSPTSSSSSPPPPPPSDTMRLSPRIVSSS